MALSSTKPRTSTEFFRLHPVSQDLPDEALSEFKALPPRERYEVVVRLRGDPIQNRFYVSKLFGVPPEIRNLPTAEGMLQLIHDTEEEIGNGRIKGPVDLWERRFKTARMLCQLESWQFALQMQAVGEPSDERFAAFEAAHGALLEGLRAYYDYTNPDSEGRPSNALFDTDGDGVFDDEDMFPRDPLFSSDANNDSMPDELAAGSSWQSALKPGEERDLRLSDGKVPLSIKRTEAGLVLKIHIRFDFESERAREEYRRLWPDAQTRVSGFVSERAPLGVRVEIVEDNNAANRVFLRDSSRLTDDTRENKGEWLSDMLTEARTRDLAHELMHLVGAGDVYQENYVHGRDHVFQPGWNVFAYPRNILDHEFQDPAIEPCDLLVPFGITIYRSENPKFTGRLQMDAYRAANDKLQMCEQADRLGEKTHAVEFAHAALDLTSKSIVSEPNDSAAWHCRGMALIYLAALETNAEAKQGFLLRGIQSLKRAIALTPIHAPLWRDFATACEEMTKIPGIEKNRYFGIARRARERARALMPRNSSVAQFAP